MNRSAVPVGSRRPSARPLHRAGRAAVLASSVLTTVLLAGCAGEAADDAPRDTGSAAEAPAPADSPAPTDTPAPAEQPTTAPVSEGPADPAGSPAAPGGGTEGEPGWPIESVPTHGARLWAAYLAVGAPGDPALQAVLEEVQQLWPGAGLGELRCDDGAAAALGRDAAEHAVAVYFPTEKHITEFRRRWDAPYVGAVPVTTYCAD